MDEDAEFDDFIQGFLHKDFERKSTRVRHSTEQLRSGLSLVGVGSSIQVVRKPLSQRRDAQFHQMLEDMANDIMENGPRVPAVASREASPRASVDSPASQVAGRYAMQDSLHLSHPSLARDKSAESSEEASSDESEHGDVIVDDMVDEPRSPIKKASSESPQKAAPESPKKYIVAPCSPEPPTHICVSVALDTEDHHTLFDSLKLELDSPVVDLFTQVEGRYGKQIQALIAPHGHKLERAEYPIKWSGLRDGDAIVAVHFRHAPLEERRIVFPPSPLLPQKSIKTPQRHADSLSQSWMEGPFPNLGPVSMGAFGDTIAASAQRDLPTSQWKTKSQNQKLVHSRTSESSLPPQPSGTGSGLLDRLVHSRTSESLLPPQPSGTGSGLLESADLPSYWSGFGNGALDTGLDDELADHWHHRSPQNGKKGEKRLIVGNEDSEVVDVSRLSDTFTLPIPPAILPDEFEDFPADAWTTPPQHRLGLKESLDQHAESNLPDRPMEAKLLPMHTTSGSPSKPQHSPVPSHAAATPTKSGLDLAAPTPSRRSLGPPVRTSLDKAELKRRQEEMQKRSDAIWANIAETLGPSPSPAKMSVDETPNRRSLLASSSPGLGTKRLLKQR